MLQSVIKYLPEIVVVIDREGIVRFSNQQLEKVLGLRAEDVVGRNIFAFIHPEDVARAKFEYSQTIRMPGENIPSTLRIRDTRGDWVPFEIIANNRLHDPEIEGVIFTARDLRFRKEVNDAIKIANTDIEKRFEERTTELAKANAALRLENQSRQETERRLQDTISLLNATLDSTADGILVVNRRGEVTGCNQRFFEMWHLQCSSAVGLRDAGLVSNVAEQLQDPQEFTSKIQELYSDPAAVSYDVLHFKNGLIYERYSQPQRLGDRVVGRVWSFRDVTATRRLEAELRHSQKMEAIGRLAGGVAHDFNNLLMLISGYAEQLSKTRLSGQQRQICEEVIATTRRGGELTRQLLAFSRKRQATPTVTSLNVIISGLKPMLRSLLSERTQLEISLSQDPVPILVDVTQLEVVLMNLAINAHDAMPDGGVFLVATGKEDRDSKPLAVLTVADSGKGMPPEVQERIFEPFFTTKAMGKGTGLGLSTVYGIVERAGGTIEVQSQPNEGTQFRIYLPSTQEVYRADTSTPVSPEGGSETILLAEDEAGIRTMTKAYLEGLGYKVLDATDGADAVEVSTGYSGIIDLLVTDVLMPRMRGDVLFHTLRKKRPYIKVLYISGFEGDSGADEPPEVLLKPFEFPELGQRVRSILDSKPALKSRMKKPA